MEKETITSIKNRIDSEYRKHKELDWSLLAAQKIYNNHFSNLKVYQVLYNDDSWDSAMYTLSTHRTLEGARKVLAKHLWEQKNKFDSRYKYDVNEMPFRFWGKRRLGSY